MSKQDLLSKHKLTEGHISRLGYDPTTLPRELENYYICSSNEEIEEMLKAIGAEKRQDLYSHLSPDILFSKAPDIGDKLAYGELQEHLENMAAKNNTHPSFIGDGLKWNKVHPIVPFVCNLRGLTTAYTPYQPERSQGTLHTLWIYSSCLSMLTGFEAINASFYERSTALYEAFNTASRINKKNVMLVSAGIYPGDLNVLKTLALETKIEIIEVPLSKENGLLDMDALNKLIEKEEVSALAFPQINSLGLLEDVHEINNLVKKNGKQSIALIDPSTLAKEGLCPPSDWGEQGADMLVGEGQHLAIGPNFGGPGLGIFGVRYNDDNKVSIRSTAGRYIGKAKDEKGQDCLAMVLSTREQHIRREKATSNICSNQSFLASAAGASMLAKGEEGLKSCNQSGVDKARKFATDLYEKTSLTLLYPDTPFYNEVAVSMNAGASNIIKQACHEGLHIGVNLDDRNQNGILVFFNDEQSDEDYEKLIAFFTKHFPSNVNLEDVTFALPQTPKNLLRENAPGLPNFDFEEVKTFYSKLSLLNVSPDDKIYPLGSCTMKYNPYINDYAANLSGFTDIHPQAPEQDAQGSLELLFHTQEIFKAITGLPAVTTQPVAGAQGELVGLKMFQAYHRDNGNAELKDIVLIPASAHGTNPATATMAGYTTTGRGDKQTGIVTIKANSSGQIDMDNLKECVELYGKRIAAVMVTNPNTSGLFEQNFKEMADLIHGVDGLVYMDGANMNAIASWTDLNAMGVDAVHNNLHKTWTVPHGGGGPGDAIVAVSEKLIDYLPGIQVKKESDSYMTFKAPKSIGSFHRHLGNFAHKVRSYTYIKALGSDGVQEMSAIAVLCAKYLYHNIKNMFPILPRETENEPRMHEFIITITDEMFSGLKEAGTSKNQAMARIGKLFLDFGLHAPTVAFPEPLGLMIEPTESFSKKELDEFIEVLAGIKDILNTAPEVLTTVPHFTPVRKIDEVSANKNLTLWENIKELPVLPSNAIEPHILSEMSSKDILNNIRDI
jgi:glycine dehydrogenase